MFVRQLFESALRLPGEFAGVAIHDPLSAVLLAVGAVLIFVSVGYFGYLVVGALVELFTPTSG